MLAQHLHLTALDLVNISTSGKEQCSRKNLDIRETRWKQGVGIFGIRNSSKKCALHNVLFLLSNLGAHACDSLINFGAKKKKEIK
jgi:hypothetical protein